MKNSLRIVAALTASMALACGDRAENGASGESSTAAAKPAPTARPRVELPAGTTLSVILDTSVSSKTSQAGDLVEAHLASDLKVGDKVVAPAGSRVRGAVTAAVPSGRVKTRARLAFVFNTLVLAGGGEQAIETSPIDITADDTHKEDAVKIGGGAGAGAVIGAIAGGKKGAGVGALIGAAAGGSAVLIDKGKNISFHSGANLSVETTSATEIRM